MHNERNEGEWFANWFNSPFYHKLYANRDYNEADFFIGNLVSHLHLSKHTSIWDLACGKGRHSIKMNALGYNVVGTDLSENSIAEASRFSNNNLDFFVHDMRTPFRINYFNAVFNLFTSIGYFDDESDNFKVFESVYHALKPDGVFVIDYLNAKKVSSCLVLNDVVKREDVEFKITKRIENNRVIKRIEFESEGKLNFFEEKVFLYQLDSFLKFADKCGFKLVETFGDYSLQPFNDTDSDRLIMIFKK
ncbi:MAG: class I SAM-dependent methyltransferase [Sphingobacteriaceae bacterium]